MTSKELDLLLKIRQELDDLIAMSGWLPLRQACEASGLDVRQLHYRAQIGEIPKKKEGSTTYYFIART